MQTWRRHAFEIEPLSADFPQARSLIVVRSERTIKKTGPTSTESRYYLASVVAGDASSRQWLEWIRGHWGGVEVRNHWRRDALLGEDGTRSRKPNLLANVALIRNALLQTRCCKCWPALWRPNPCRSCANASTRIPLAA